MCFLLLFIYMLTVVGSITSGEEERAYLSAWDGLRYFIVALPEPSI